MFIPSTWIYTVPSSQHDMRPALACNFNIVRHTNELEAVTHSWTVWCDQATGNFILSHNLDLWSCCKCKAISRQETLPPCRKVDGQPFDMQLSQTCVLWGLVIFTFDLLAWKLRCQLCASAGIFFEQNWTLYNFPLSSYTPQTDRKAEEHQYEFGLMGAV